MNTQSMSMRNFLEDWFSKNITGFAQVILLATFRHESLVVDIGSCEVTSVQSEDILLELASVIRDAISMEIKKCRNFSRQHLKSVKFYSPDGIDVSTKNFCDLTIKIGIMGEIFVLVRDCNCNCLLKIERIANERMGEINKIILSLGPRLTF